MGARRAQRIHTALVIATAAMLLLGSRAAGAVIWTLTGTPLTATQSAQSTFKLTVTDLSLLDEIGCVVVDTTSAFAVSAVSVGTASSGRTWLGTHTATTVTVTSQDGGGRLQMLDTLTFTVDATPLTSGLSVWSAVAYRQQDCTGTTVPGIPTVAVTVLPSPTPTPRPSVSPVPTPRSTPSPAPSVATSPTPGSSATQGSAEPSLGGSAPGVTATGTPSPTATQQTVAAPGGVSESSPAPGGAGVVGNSSSASLWNTGPGDGTMVIGGSGTSVGVGGFVVPVTVFGVSGLLTLLWVGLQVIGGLVWLPAARRVRDDDRRQRRDAT